MREFAISPVLHRYLSLVANAKGKMSWYYLGVMSGVPRGAMERVRRANLLLGRKAQRWYAAILDTLFHSGLIGREKLSHGMTLVREITSREWLEKGGRMATRRVHRFRTTQVA